MKTVILGGGPSGLGVALGLVEAGHRDIVIVEKAAVLGGLSASIKIGNNIADYGPHRLSPEYPDIVARAKKFLGDDLLEVPNDHAVVFQNHVYRYPPVLGDFLNVPTVLTTVRVLYSFFRERVLFYLGRRRPLQIETFESLIVSRFGRALYEEVVKPMSTKVWGNPSTLDPEFARLRFSVPTIVAWWKKLIGRQGNFNDKVFFYPRHGFQQLWDTMGEYLTANGVEIWKESRATRVHISDSHVASVTIDKNGETMRIPVDYLVSTIPTQHLLRILSPNPLPGSQVFGAKLKNRGMLLAYYLVKKPKSLPARVVILPEEKYFFNRLSEQNQFSRENVEEGKSLVLADVLADVDSKNWNMSDADVASIVAKQIESIGFFSADEIEAQGVIRVPLAYPLPTIEREKEQARLNIALGEISNLLCTGRFASSDYNNSHTALKKGLMAAQIIDEGTPVPEWYQTAEEIRKTAIRD